MPFFFFIFIFRLGKKLSSEMMKLLSREFILTTFPSYKLALDARKLVSHAMQCNLFNDSYLYYVNVHFCRGETRRNGAKFYNNSRKKIYRFNATIITLINLSVIFAFFKFFFFFGRLIKFDRLI